MKAWLVGWLAVWAALAGRAAEHDFPHPDRIRYDGQCLTIDGQDRFIFGGSFHYFRCPPELWRDRFRALKAAGCNTVTTNVPWNWHERTPPPSADAPARIDLSDLREWLRIAHDEFGLYTIVRPGPYVGGEWDGGGLPRWLLSRRPAGIKGRWLRTSEPEFLAWCDHWYRAVCAAVAPGQIFRRPPGTGGTILMQLENEYDYDRGIAPAQRSAVLKNLERTARDCGIEVPLFTCWTRECRDSDDPALAPVFDAIAAYPRWEIEKTGDALAELEAAQPDAPEMVSELQGGWFSAVGGLPSAEQPGLTAEQLQAHALLAIADGATVINTYLAVGGTNFGRWAARGVTTTYDYDAPIGEWGEAGAKYRVFAALGQLIRAHGSELARSRPARWPIQSGSPDVTVGVRVERSGATWLFFHNRSLTERRAGRAAIWSEKAGEFGADYDLAPFESKVLRLPPRTVDEKDGAWLPARAQAVPASPAPIVPIPVALQRYNPAQGRMHSFILTVAEPGELLPELGIFDARPVIYSTEADLTAAQAQSASLRLQVYRDDRVVADINGRIVAGEARNGTEELAPGGALRTGRNSIQLLYYQGGQPDRGNGLDEEPGLRSASLGGLPLSRFTYRPVDFPSEDVESRLVSAYRGSFNLPADTRAAALNLNLEAAGDGELFLNGHPLGRYWEAGPQHRFFLPPSWRKDGPNELRIFLIPDARGEAALRAAVVEAYPISSAESR
ncbi:MAG TPA: beta-galactosidase [Opitutaceae bacterium]|jgi:hypothetical protein